jgi:hypothetical protein
MINGELHELGHHFFLYPFCIVESKFYLIEVINSIDDHVFFLGKTTA